MTDLDPITEAERQLRICNACRYCEGFCAVFPAIEIRKDFEAKDIFYLSNLCHDCRACYTACMFTPPHDFAINIPKMMSQIRVAGYRRWSWPDILARSFEDRRRAIALALFAFIAVFALAFLLVPSSRTVVAHRGPGAFYEIVPYWDMVIPAVLLFFFGLAVWLRGAARFRSETLRPGGNTKKARTILRALDDVLRLRYLKGGGDGCFYPHEEPSPSRRIFHALTFWGFLSTFVSTTVAFFDQDLLHRLPPYPLLSAPVVFGTVGGIALILGVSGLLLLKRRSDSEPAATAASGMDYLFLVTLGCTAVTGMLTLLFRATSALGPLLTIHLAAVAALFITAPYGKFVHVVYRSLAVLQYQSERTQEGR